jgi:flagellar biosynthetic protein FliR
VNEELSAGLLRDVGAENLVGFILVLARLTPLFIFAPLFSSRMLSARVRGIVLVALAVGITPVALASAKPPLDALGIGQLVIKELVIGLAFAFTVGLLIFALQVAGGILDTLIGFSFGASVDPLTGNQGSAVLSQLYGLLGVLVFITIGGDQVVIRGIAETYELIPILSMPDMNQLIAGTLEAFVGLFTSALQVAAPVILALVLTDAAFGLVTKVVPQLNVFSVGVPAKVLVGILLITASLPFVAGYVSDELESSVRTALGSLGVSS